MDLEQLTKRERSILEFVSMGLSNEGIAEQLSLSTKTVEAATRSIFLKLGLGESAPHENRRVKAVLRYLDASSTSPEREGRLPRQARELVASAPFDTLASILEHQPIENASPRWVTRATAAWYAVIYEDFARAGRLARRSIDLAHGSTLGECITRGLASVVDAFAALAPLDQSRLDDVVSAVLGDSADRVEIGHLVANLEIPNWLTYADRFGDAAAVIDRALGGPELDTHEVIALHCCLVELDLRRGRWTQCELNLSRVFEASAQAGISTGYADALAARVHALRGNGDLASSHLRAARASGFDRGDRSTVWRADGAECLLWLGPGDFPQAALLATPLIEARGRAELRLPAVRWWDLDVFEALWATGQLDTARQVSVALRRDVELTGSRSGAAHLLIISALLDEESAERARRLRQASTALADLGLPFEQARAALFLAENSIDRSGDEARSAAREATRIFDALGATPWAERAHRASKSRP